MWIPSTGGSLPTGTTKGDLAVFDGTNWVRVGVGSDDTVLTADAAQLAGVKWAASSGGGGGGGGLALPRPADLSGSDDDDFSDAALTGWSTILPSGSHTVTAGDDVLSAKYSGQSAADLAGISRSVALSVGDSIQTGFKILNPTTTEFAMAALVMGDGNTAASNKVAFYFQLQTSGGSNYLFVTRGGTWAAVGSDIQLSSSSPFHTRVPVGYMHMRFTYQASNTFRSEISFDGVSWHQMLPDSSRTLTPSTAGLGWTVWGGSATPINTFGYFKVNQ